MKYSGIGGQSVMEGVMMRNGPDYAIAVRKPDHEIEVKVEKNKGSLFDNKWMKIPIIRGVLSFIDSLVVGLSTLMYSASFFEDEEEEEEENEKKRERKNKKTLDPEKQEKRENAMMTGVLVFSLILAIAVFMILPYYLSELFQRFVTDRTNVVAIFEGVLRLAIFVVYILLISRMEDIQRTFMYHGAEHKCINCIEHGLDLTVDNVRISSREHKRCGTSFLVFVIVISIILYLFIRVDSHVLRIVIRILLIPVIAGLSYELLRAAGRTENKVINVLSMPGMWMQRLTVKEPDDEMIEVGIASVEAVFDWRPFVEEVRREDAAARGTPLEEDTDRESASEEYAESSETIENDGEDKFWL
ncbi:MAG: DUF1385 domain-containing protein [Lachnospiraceae bacterium]|nr:DUF1385 domain-containing protein [Lachnospiraceae bacterium]